MSHATHANAALTPRARLRLAQLVIDHGWPVARAAERFEVSWKTAAKWADRYQREGGAGMVDRSSGRAVGRARPRRWSGGSCGLRLRHRMGPVQIGDLLGVPASTVHAVLVRCRLNRLTYLDRATGERIRRYEHERPGDLLHVDVKKLGNVPDGGGWRYVGRQQGGQNRAATLGPPGCQEQVPTPLMGTCFLHTVIDDHSRVAYVEAHDDQTEETAPMVLRNAVAWFNARGVTIHRVLSDNGGCLPRPSCGATPAPSSGSPTNAPAPTGPRPTAR